jgi:hypothetical protein
MVPGQDGPQIEEDTMHPMLSQAVAAERIREWRDQAGRDQLASQARRARRQAAAVAAELPRPRGGSGHPAVPAPAEPVAVASREPVAVASGQPAACEDRQPAGGRAA